MHLFVPPSDVGDRRAVIRGDDARHLTTVLRARPGTPLTLADGTGTVHRARVTAVGDPVTVALTGSRHHAPPRPAITVAHALPKGRKLDDVVRRLTELGVERIVPLHSARSQVQLEGPKAAKAHARWTAVAHAAAKQSRRARLPTIDPVGEWSTWRPDGPGLVLWEEATAPLRPAAEALVGADDLTLAVGPEGGLTADEVAATDLRPVTLGATVLRTEFASLAGTVAVMTLVGRFGT